MTITFEGRVPHPGYASIGMDGEHNAETLILEGLPEHEGKTVVLNIILPNGTADALAVTDGQVTITRNTTLPGTATAWVSILDGTDYVWKSEKILLRVGQLPDIDTPIEQQYPGIVEQAVKAIEEAGQLIGGVPAGGTAGQVLAKKTGADHDTEWQTVQGGGGVPSGGYTGQVLRKKSSTAGDVEWSGYTIPAGGYTGEALRKTSNSAGAAEWGGYTVPGGGDVGQVLSKATGNAGETTWKTVREIPSGGTSGQVLAKSSNSNYAVTWVDKPTGIPTGGNTGQVLRKKSSTSGDVEWGGYTLPSGGADGDLVTKEYGAGAWTSRIAREYSTNYVDGYNQIHFGRTNPYSDQDQGADLWNDYLWGRPVHFFFQHDTEDPDNDTDGSIFLNMTALADAGYEGDSPFEVFYIKLERLLPDLTTRTRYFRVYFDGTNEYTYVMTEVTPT